MDTDYNKHTASLCLFSPLSGLNAVSVPFFHLSRIFLDGAGMTTARFDMWVAMEDHFSEYGYSHAIVLIK